MDEGQTAQPAKPAPDAAGPAIDGECSTLEVARRLGMAVRSVQLMVDRGELQAWKTPGGHRRIARSSVERWLQRHRSTGGVGEAGTKPMPGRRQPRHVRVDLRDRQRVLLIEDSRHFQNLVSLLVRQQFPEVALEAADDGIAGLALAGKLQPDVLLVDILLPGIDGGALISSLRSHPAFGGCELIVITSLDAAGLAPYRFALAGVPVIHKPQLVIELPPLLQGALSRRAALLSA